MNTNGPGLIEQAMDQMDVEDIQAFLEQLPTLSSPVGVGVGTSPCGARTPPVTSRTSSPRMRAVPVAASTPRGRPARGRREEGRGRREEGEGRLGGQHHAAASITTTKIIVTSYKDRKTSVCEKYFETIL